ncbi:MAG: cation:proton antiporter [Bacteroidales bacterium]|nr:cation:proton antiporter [Bacteroidales bacterium]
MHDYPIFLFVALLIFGYGLFSKKSGESMITAPMVFVAVGLAASFIPVDFLKGGIRAPFFKVIAEITLVLILFIDASTINLRTLIKEKGIPFRLLLIGLPLTMAVGTLLAMPLFPSLGIWTLCLMAFMLSPTDAALGKVVVTSPRIPEKIRQAINVESGLNDGIALPPILVCIAALADVPGAHNEADYWVFFTLKQLILGPLIGAAVGWLGGWLVDKASKAGWMNSTFQRLTSVSLALMAFTLAEIVYGNGFIAAFFAGLFLGTRTPEVRERIQEFGEAEGEALELFIFLLFGMILVPMSLAFWNINTWIYAILSLTIIRMIPVAISLLGSGLSWQSVGFVGWFGPRGIASILYLVLVLITLGFKGNEQIMSTVVMTVMLSVFLHGLSALPLSKIYRK